MGKKKVVFEEVLEMRKTNHEKFISTIFDNFSNRTFFDGEVMFKTDNGDKWIYLTQEEKEQLLKLANEKSERRKSEIIKECNERYDRTKDNPLLESYEDYSIARVICASLEEGQRIPEWLFIKACKLFEKHRENEDTLWKSYSFKGFVRWSQIETAMKHKENSTSRSE